MSIRTLTIDPVYRQLAVKLTEEERLARALEAAAKMEAYTEAEMEKSGTTKRLGEKMKELRAEMETLQRAVRTGQEYQPVQVVERRNEERYTVELVRMDTLAVIESRPMTVEERQMSLFDENGEMRRNGGDA